MNTESKPLFPAWAFLLEISQEGIISLLAPAVNYVAADLLREALKLELAGEGIFPATVQVTGPLNRATLLLAGVDDARIPRLVRNFITRCIPYGRLKGWRLDETGTHPAFADTVASRDEFHAALKTNCEHLQLIQATAHALARQQ